MRLAIIALSTFLATGAFAAGTECGMKAITACGNTNNLVWAKSFKPALKRFAGKQKVRWLGPKMSLPDVISEVIGGGGDDMIVVSPGLYRFNAFRPHSATERGAVFISADGAIKAAGVLHFNCEKNCDSKYHLAVILRAPDEVLEKQVRAWGDEETRKNADQGYEADLNAVAQTDVIVVKK